MIRFIFLRKKVKIQPVDRENAPTILVQIPCYNEERVVERAIDNACRLDWPRDRLEIQIIDTSTDRTPVLADRRATYWRQNGVNVRVLHRPTREGFKAGSLVYGLERSEADYVALLDSDFVTPPIFLKKMMVYFRDDVACVQARQDFLNRTENLLTRAQSIFLDVFYMYLESQHRVGYDRTFV
eukprot:42929_1